MYYYEYVDIAVFHLRNLVILSLNVYNDITENFKNMPLLEIFI